MKKNKKDTLMDAFIALQEAENNYLKTVAQLLSDSKNGYGIIGGNVDITVSGDGIDGMYCDILTFDGIRIKDGEFWLHCKYGRDTFKNNSWVSEHDFDDDSWKYALTYIDFNNNKDEDSKH